MSPGGSVEVGDPRTRAGRSRRAPGCRAGAPCRAARRRGRGSRPAPSARTRPMPSQTDGANSEQRRWRRPATLRSFAIAARRTARRRSPGPTGRRSACRRSSGAAHGSCRRPGRTARPTSGRTGTSRVASATRWTSRARPSAPTRDQTSCVLCAVTFSPSGRADDHGQPGPWRRARASITVTIASARAARATSSRPAQDGQERVLGDLDPPDLLHPLLARLLLLEQLALSGMSPP